ncbi:MAG: putative endonuclease, partial [Planctomycetota bacterium]
GGDPYGSSRMPTREKCRQKPNRRRSRPVVAFGPRLHELFGLARALWLRFAPRTFLRWGNPSTAELGLAGEELGARWLVSRGWRVVARRQRTPMAEIDLVARMGDQLVCVEVKTGRIRGRSRAGPADPAALAWRPGERLSARSLARQRRAGEYLARAWGREKLRGGRVDLIEVLLESGRTTPSIVHHPRLSEPI